MKKQTKQRGSKSLGGALVACAILCPGLAFAQSGGAWGETASGAETSEAAPATREAGSKAVEAVVEAAGPEAAAASGGTGFNRELLTIEEQVHTLKEQVFRAKATLQLLKEIVIAADSSGSRATIMHVNKLGKGYVVESVSYFLDGQGKFAKADPTGELDNNKEFKVFDGAIPPGNHQLTVNMKLRGNGFGIFSYVKDYNFDVQSSTAFVAEEGKSCSVKVITNERGGIGRSFTERPNVSFETRCVRLSDRAEAPEQ